MKKRLLTLLLAALLLLSILPAAGAAGETRLYDWSFEIFDRMNELRAQNGLSPLTMDETLLECSMIRGAELASNYSHTRPNGRQWYTVYPGTYRAMGENIGYGYTSAQQAYDLWAGSRDHRENILNPEYTCCGVGMVRVGNTVYGVELFADSSCLKKAVSASQYVSGGYSGNSGNGGAGSPTSSTPTPTNNQPSTGYSRPTTVAGFRDVLSNSYYANAVQWAVNRRIVSGTGSSTFSPNQSCTRGEIVTLLWRAAGSPRMYGSCPFRDVSTSDYFYQACVWAVRNGITYGTTSTTFSPNQICSRGEAVTFLWRNAGQPRVTRSSGFWDVPSDAYYATAVAWAHQNGIAEGTTFATFSPNLICTRAQIVLFIYRWKT